MEEVNRKIHFYQIVWVDNNGEKVQKDIQFIHTILTKVSGQLVKYKDGDFLYIEVYGTNAVSNSNIVLYSIAKIRKSDLPLKFDINNKDISPLNLTNNEGLFEPSHFVIFDGKIIGAEYNHYGVRQINSKLEWLINKYIKRNTLTDIKRVEIKPILKKEVYDLIEKFVEIRGIRISIATNYAKLLKQEDPVSFEQMFSAAEIVDDMWLHLTFSLGRGKKYGDSAKFEKVLKSIKKILSREYNKNNVNVIEIKGKLEGSDSIESINVLEELMLTEKKVLKLDDKTRAVNPESMYKEIIDSYFALKDELKEFVNPVRNEENSR
ncbi:MAG TPA: hypothetical protein EYG92_07095 [Lutibacter sp.]|nr:hypothetical protein [Lutibacter sp.]